jgi:type VI protein secretion system component VasK
MRRIIEGPPEEGDPQRPLSRRLLWFVVLAAAGAGATALVAYSLRALIL